MNFDTNTFDNWLLGEDFNFYRGPDDRNKPGGDPNEMSSFNNLILDLDLTELPSVEEDLLGATCRKTPCLSKLIGCLPQLNGQSLTLQLWHKPSPNQFLIMFHMLSTLAAISPNNMFRFENFWIDHLLDTVKLHWDNAPFFANAAKNLVVRLKQVRSGLRKWSRKLSNLNKLIYNCNWVLSLLDGLEEQRTLSRLETSFKRLVTGHLNGLKEAKRIYWRQRNTCRWVKFGDENSHFFHLMATTAHKRNFIVSLTDQNGDEIMDHDQKANLLWLSFKEKLGISEYSGMHYNLNQLVDTFDLSDLDPNFSVEEIEWVVKELPNEHAPVSRWVQWTVH